MHHLCLTVSSSLSTVEQREREVSRKLQLVVLPAAPQPVGLNGESEHGTVKRGVAEEHNATRSRLLQDSEVSLTTSSPDVLPFWERAGN